MSRARFYGPSGIATRSPSRVFNRRPDPPDLVNLWRIDAGTDSLVWAVRLLDTVTGVAMGSGQLYVTASNSTETRLYAINLSSGAVIWSVAVEATIDDEPTFVAGITLAADAAGNAYVTLGDSIGKYNSSGTLVGSFEPAGSPVFQFVSYDAANDLLVAAGSGFGGLGLIKFNTSLTELATTGSDGDFERAYYSGNSVWDDVWSAHSGAVGVWWFAPPEDEASLPPGYPPSAVGRVSRAWSITGDLGLLYGIGDKAIVNGEKDVSTERYATIAQWQGETAAEPTSANWEHQVSDFDLLDTDVTGQVSTAHQSGGRVYLGVFFNIVGNLAAARSVMVLDESDGTLQKKYRLGNASGLASGSAIYGSGDDIYVGTSYVQRQLAVSS
jgi:hypothetical protein